MQGRLLCCCCITVGRLGFPVYQGFGRREYCGISGWCYTFCELLSRLRLREARGRCVGGLLFLHLVQEVTEDQGSMRGVSEFCGKVTKRYGIVVFGSCCFDKFFNSNGAYGDLSLIFEEFVRYVTIKSNF